MGAQVIHSLFIAWISETFIIYTNVPIGLFKKVDHYRSPKLKQTILAQHAQSQLIVAPNIQRSLSHDTGLSCFYANIIL